VRENDDKYRVYLDGGVGQDLYDPQPMTSDPQHSANVPFCLGIVGDFSGRQSRLQRRERPDLAGRPLLRVTPENVLNLAGLTPEIGLSESPEGVSDLSLQFSTLDDFHPDRLYGRLHSFRRHRDAKDRLESGGGGVEAEREEPEVSGGPREPEEAGGASGPLPGSGLLDAILGETERETPKAGTDMEEDLDAFIRRVVRPHVVETDPDRTGKIGEMDRNISGLMTALMHTPEFREMEALWRSVVFLLSRIEVSTNLRVYLIDVSEAELVADLLSTDEPTEWGFAHTMLRPVSENGEELRWAALLGTFEFGRDAHQVPLLQRIGLLAESGEIPWFSGGHSSLLGSRSLQDQPNPEDWTEDLDPLWVELRANPEAEWINLSLPGFLLRTPYGPDGGKTKRFDYAEEAVFPKDLLWGSPSVLWGVALAREFTRFGWSLRVGGQQTVSQIPIHPTQKGWLTCLQGTLSVTAASRAREMGLNPIVAARNEPEAHFHGPRSISTSDRSLRAWWGDPG
jgi:type VI secretion system protein ImpC